MSFDEHGHWQDTPCEICPNIIPKAVMQKKKKGQQSFTCSRECEVKRRQQNGWYKEWSLKGHDARVEAVTKSNHEHPRRRKKTAV